MNRQTEKYISQTGEEGFFKRNLAKLKIFVVTVFVGILAGTQFYSPNKRVIEAIVGSIVLFMLWQVSTLSALWFVLLSYPFPFGISWGHSNVIFIMIIAIMLLVRVGSGAEKFRLDRTIALPVGILVLAYIFSFNNVAPGSALMRSGLVNFGNFLAAAGFALLLINFVDDEEKFEKAVKFMIVTNVLVIIYCAIEIMFPGHVLVPGWLKTHHARSLVMRGIRIKGPFNNYELNAEYFTLNSFIVFFAVVRTRRLLIRSLLYLILIADLLMMFAAVTRGAFYALLAGVIYLMFLSRKELNIVRFFYIVIAFVVLLFVLEGIVANYTASGSLFDRIVTSTFERGFIPKSRSEPWEMAIERGMQHPFFGNGPGWDFASGETKGFWPHNIFLFYFNSLGLFGLAAFLLLLYRLVKATIPGIKASITKSSYPEAFMKILHVILVIFILDQIKIEYLRNRIYVFFVWTLFAMIIITRNIIEKKRSGDLPSAPGSA